MFFNLIKPKIIIIYILLLLSMYQKVQAWSIIPPNTNTYIDKQKSLLLIGINGQIILGNPLVTSIDQSLDNATLAFKNAIPKIKEVQKTLKDYENTVEKWRKDTVPDQKGTYERIIDTAINDLKNVGKFSGGISTTDLEKIEEKDFYNQEALNNAGEQYAQGNSRYESTFKQGVLCASNKKPDFKDNLLEDKAFFLLNKKEQFGALQNTSCHVIHNATAYKVSLSELIKKKQEIIDTAINNILKENPKTIGEFDGRRLALLSIKALQQGVIDEYLLKINKANITIQIAEESSKYANQSLLVGPAKNWKRSLIADGAKTAFGEAVKSYTSTSTDWNE